MTTHGEKKSARSQISVFCLPQSKYKEKKIHLQGFFSYNELSLIHS